MRKNAVAVLSGGMDSSALVLAPPTDLRLVGLLSVDYGQRHGKRELAAARYIAKHVGVHHQVVDLSGLAAVMKGSALTDDVPVPHGHYEDESMKATVVPNRNMILLSVAAAYAISCKASVIAYGAHAGDHAVYPDCRREFVMAMQAALALCDYESLELRAPFITYSKADIVRLAANDGVADQLGFTWSCYEGGEIHCGRCGTCVERKEAFWLAGVADPTGYKA